jgi:fumarate hydratase class II
MRVKESTEYLFELAQGGTAVGTGLNCPEALPSVLLSRWPTSPASLSAPAPNKFEALAAHDAYVFVHGALNTLAVSLFKIANDIRFLASGPRSGIGELILPENEPGSSIMPGKVNPTQAEAMTMVCAQVMGNQTTLRSPAARATSSLTSTNLSLAHNMLQSVRLLSDACGSFADNCVVGIAADEERIRELMERSLMLVTALAPRIGYDNATLVAKTAHKNGTTFGRKRSRSDSSPRRNSTKSCAPRR